MTTEKKKAYRKKYYEEVEKPKMQDPKYIRKRVEVKITHVMKQYPYHRASYCYRCDRWFSKAKNILRCPDCKIPLKLWPKNSRSKAKYKKKWEQNQNARSRLQRYRDSHKEQTAKYNKKYYEKNKDKIISEQSKKKLHQASRDWKKRNEEQQKEYRKKYYQEVEKPRRQAIKQNSDIVEPKKQTIGPKEILVQG